MKKLFFPLAMLQMSHGAGYVDNSGNFIGGRTATSQTLQQFQNAMGSVTQCQPKGNYITPQQFNLTANNTTGAAVVYKFTQADNMTESMRGSIGTAWFSVQQLPFGNGTITKQDGTLINGAETLARSLQTYGYKIGKITATGTALATYGQTLVIDAWRGNLSGANQENWTLNLDTNNSSATPTLVLVPDGGIDLTSNVSFSCSVPAGQALNLQFVPMGYIPYL